MNNIIPASKRSFTVILSAKTPDIDVYEAQKRHRILRDLIGRLLPSLTVVECRGSYKGEEEDSLAVLNVGNFDLMAIDDIASAFMQESTLCIDSGGHGFLRFQSAGKPFEAIGLLIWIAPVDKPKHEAWTQIVSNDKTFIFA